MLARARAWMPAGLLDAPYELGLAPKFRKGERLSETVKRSARFGARKASLPLGPGVARGVLDALALLGPEALPLIAAGHGAVDAIDRATRENGRRRARPNAQPRVPIERRVTARDVLAELARRGPLTDDELADAIGVFGENQSDRDSRAFHQLERVLGALVRRRQIAQTWHGEYHLPGNPPRRNGRHASTRPRRARRAKRSAR